MTEYDLGKVVGDDGPQGPKGDTGDTGNGIASIVLRSTVGKVKTYRITYTNGGTFDFQVTDGEDGSGATVEIVTSWNSTTSDTKVPSEKLSKDSLDAKAPTSHAHGNLTNDGKVGSTANLPVITTTGGVLTTGSFGTAANTFCQGNDSRLSDARTPLSHTHSISDVTNLQTSLDGKINTSDIENNLTTTTSGKVLDARQGKALADLIGDAITYINQ